jgi:predicted protein tyrosine phosphatase
MSLILVTPLSAVDRAIAQYRPSHLASLLSPGYMIDTPQSIVPANHLRLALHDIATPADGQVLPQATQVDELIAFGRAWDMAAPMLVHCWAGVSRSMAAAFILMCDRAEEGAEFSIARKMRARAPHASPNRLIVRFADAALDRDGRMIQALEDIGPGKFVEEGVPVEFPLEIMLR